MRDRVYSHSPPHRAPHWLVRIPIALVTHSPTPPHVRNSARVLISSPHQSVPAHRHVHLPLAYLLRPHATPCAPAYISNIKDSRTAARTDGLLSGRALLGSRSRADETVR
ncbi:hypothetical protein HYPSUDRAFT_894837 [Hypholoma sublateritium FD-334 SS-4]|uniref:Uncharacterized protein n=1 Tax=Hypholoma sublateritium (strain FD-334 SS-4) TaxID=945553 RepID=A0A0D2NRG3_HYPSF|nr:hypothetical protein HYPSUDRAFT_894837 [Hypholoma sublateritium FD-334 SS-4]